MRTLEVEFLGEFESILENALEYESGDQLGYFGEITLDKKISRYCPFKIENPLVELSRRRLIEIPDPNPIEIANARCDVSLK